ncbi:hypothetical protein B9Z19DRAFT_637005 [Tuber borchii]|uniref:Uncharacterized protein n=1 Tax=Tuber borchii TaxID=42251 RepID=A0A2T6ZB64_TUBBO|nr:hypothetical protein B9Z19DRAFT_637005 [Tuber borchii]
MCGPLANPQSMFTQKILATARILAPLLWIRHELASAVALETNQQVNKMAVVVARKDGGILFPFSFPSLSLDAGSHTVGVVGWMKDVFFFFLVLMICTRIYKMITFYTRPLSRAIIYMRRMNFGRKKSIKSERNLADQRKRKRKKKKRRKKRSQNAKQNRIQQNRTKQ